jgi:hypothetical protein
MVCVRADDGGVMLNFGVAAHSRCGAKVWRLLTELPSPLPSPPERPRAPWCAVRLMPGMVQHPDAWDWLGDYERRIAWAWLQSGEGER